MSQARKSLSAAVPSASQKPLPKGWAWVRFGDVVREVNISERNPLAAGLTRFVGLEHLEPSDLRIRSWGNVADGTTFTRVFRAGQVLFGKRRAYQRKAALASFDGICSGDILVFESRPPAKGKVALAPELLPYIVQTDGFFEHALGTSAGSLSPRTKFKELAKYEFALPANFTDQARIAELLSSVDKQYDPLESAAQATLELKAAAIAEEFARLGGTVRTLESILAGRIESGYSCPPASEETGHYILSLSALSPHGYQSGQFKHAPRIQKVLNAKLKSGDFLISRSNTIDLVGIVGIFDESREDVSFPDTMMRIPVNTALVVPRYLELVFQSPLGRSYIRQTAAGTSASMKKINRKNLLKFKFPQPNKVIQEQLIAYASHFDRRHQVIERQLQLCRNLKRRLLVRLLKPIGESR